MKNVSEPPNDRKNIKAVAKEKSIEILIAISISVLSGIIGFFSHKLIEGNLTAIIISSVILFVIISFSTIWIHYQISGIVSVNQDTIDDKITQHQKEVDEAVKHIVDSLGAHRTQVTSAVRKAHKEIQDSITDANSKTSESMEKTHERVSKTLENIHHIAGISTEYLTNDEDMDRAYRKSLQIVESAKERIWIIADYSPEYEMLKGTPMRLLYYETIENKLRDKIGKKKFDYLRIMQRSKETCKEIQRNGGKITSADQIKGDEPAFSHCRNVLANVKSYNNIDVNIIVTPFVASLPSILLVDDKHILFTIPERKQGEALSTASVIHFTDNTVRSLMIRSFERIIGTVQNDNDSQNITFGAGIFDDYEKDLENPT